MRVTDVKGAVIASSPVIQVCATLPDDFIAFEYPARFEPSRHDITDGFAAQPVQLSLIDLPDRPWAPSCPCVLGWTAALPRWPPAQPPFHWRHVR